MEQNLSEKERKQRLLIGILLGITAAGSYPVLENIYLSAAIALAAIGFIFNYFTCFCGTKKLVSRIREKI